VIRALDYSSRGSVFKSRPGQKFKVSAPPVPPSLFNYEEYTDHTLSV